MEAEKEEFLKEFGGDYGYPNSPKSIDEIRATEFKRLHRNGGGGIVYLDHAGATLYSELQMEQVLNDLTSNVYANPHSQNDSASVTADVIAQSRQLVLDYFNASPKDYKCIFTSGATAALKLVGEAFPWSSNSCFMYTTENHNSVLGIREYALSKGASAFAVDIEDSVQGMSSSHVPSFVLSQQPVQRRKQANTLETEFTDAPSNLFAFPSECNFSGLRFNLDLVKLIKEDSERVLKGSSVSRGHWMVLIDAAKGSSTQPPDLSKYPADFVVISFYKLFGYPTGLGALVVHKDAAKLLRKTYFSGGTVAASFADIDFVKRRQGVEELFEDGTVSFLSIASIRHGFKILNSLTTRGISRHIGTLTNYVKKLLLAWRHGNGAPVCTIYGNNSSEALCHRSGTIVSFNLRRPDGSWFGYREVEKLASLSGIQLRTGCFCNPGACAKYLGLSHQDLLSNLEAGHICWDDKDIISGKPTGAVRISFGYMSTYEDVQKFIHFITSAFVSIPSMFASVNLLSRRSIDLSAEGRGNKPAGCFLKSIMLYPIKSCAGFSVESWPLSNNGLMYDREWLLRSLTGEVLTQKKVPEMCLISTSIDLSQGILRVESCRCVATLHINLSRDTNRDGGEEIDMYAQRFEVEHHQTDVNTWFSNAVGRPCVLLRFSSSKSDPCPNRNGSVGMCRDANVRSFANEAQFLLVSEESVADLNSRLSSRDVEKGALEQVNPMRFRPNLIISGSAPYAEDGWRSLKIGSNYFVSMGGCNRCQMINHVYQDGKVHRSKEPLATLASYRRVKGKILFGILLRHEIAEDKTGQRKDSWLRVGQEVIPASE